MAGKGTDNQGKGQKTIIGRGRARENPKGTSDPGEALRVMFDRILRNFRLHMRAPFQGTPSGDFDDVISGVKAPLGRILRNFRIRMRTPFQDDPLRGHMNFGHFREPCYLYYCTTCTTTILRKKRGKPKKVRENSRVKIREKSTLYMYILYIHCFSELIRIILEQFFWLETMQIGIKFTISFI